jgi:hypothetical protein
MGDNLFNAHHAEHQQTAFPHQSTEAQIHHSTELVPLYDENGEVYYMKCVCGYNHDDKETVFDEQCNTWQHIACYYPDGVVADVHLCLDCSPRALPVDLAICRARQQHFLYEQQHAQPSPPENNNRSKRATSKPTKKRTKEAHDAVPYQNGFEDSETAIVDYNNQPPHKRPKYHHRHTPSNGTGMLAHTAEDVPHPPHPALDECPPDYFSADFIRAHQHPDFIYATANTHLGLGIANILANWLDDKEAFSQAAGVPQEQALSHYAQDDFEELEQPIAIRYHEDTSATFHGSHPKWPIVTVERDVLQGSIIGEIRGTIGHVEDYKKDPANKWDQLQHPDHFVFFHQWLPLYIDSRTEGTHLRNVRRSCRPNIEITTIIVGARDWHHCFTAAQDISEGTELTLGWDFTKAPDFVAWMQAIYAKTITREQLAHVEEIVSTTLAHFGGCGCNDTKTCKLGRWDRRILTDLPEQPATSTTAKRARRSKKAGQGLLFANASRSGSEAVLHEDDNDDSRSRSSRSKSKEASPTEIAARDQTGGTGELSERERRKLVQQEKLFNKMEHEEQHGQRKKKRASGSNLHTPTITASRQPGRNISQASMPATPAAGIKPRVTSNGTTSYFPSTRGNVSDVRLPRPPPVEVVVERRKYVDVSTQTEPVDDTPGEASSALATRKPFLLAHRLLHRARSMGARPRTATGRPSPLAAAPAIKEPDGDLEMTDDPVTTTQPSLTAPDNQQPHPPIPPPPLPWLPEHNGTPPAHQFRGLHRHANLHVDMPPPPHLGSSASLDIPLLDTPSGMSSSTSHIPPASAPLMTPGGSMPYHGFSPIKKKMSLSAYTAKKKGIPTPGGEQTGNDGAVDTTSAAKDETTKEHDVMAIDKQEPGSSPATAGSRP